MPINASAPGRMLKKSYAKSDVCLYTQLTYPTA